MKKIQFIAFFLAICLSSAAQNKVSVLYDGDFDFTSLKTFDYSNATYKLQEKFIKQPYASKALIKHLKEKGVEKVDGQADAVVDIKVSFDKSINVNKQKRTVYSNYRATPRARGRYIGTVDTNPIEKEEKARLVINIIDQKSNQAVWTGFWQGEPDPDMDPEKRQKKIEKVLKKMFKKYPEE